MALYITDNNRRDFVWHVGKQNLPVAMSEIIAIQADGDELEHIKNKMSNIPMTDSRCVRWYGDMAKFIVSNVGV